MLGEKQGGMQARTGCQVAARMLPLSHPEGINRDAECGEHCREGEGLSFAILMVKLKLWEDPQKPVGTHRPTGLSLPTGSALRCEVGRHVWGS